MATADDDRATGLDRWSRMAGFTVERLDDVRRRLVVDPIADLVFVVDLGRGDDPLRVHDRFRLTTPHPARLDHDVVESVVLTRSAMVDGRLVAPDIVETVVAVYPDGLTRHTFMTAVFEIQKVRTLVRREADRRAADAATVAELERLVGESAR